MLRWCNDKDRIRIRGLSKIGGCADTWVETYAW
jgi:hypothetical protein